MKTVIRHTTDRPEYWDRLSPQRARELYRQIRDKMKKDKTYRNPSYTVRMLADEMQLNTQYIAVALAVGGQTNYLQLVNELRLREVRRYFRSPAHQHWSVQNIGMLAGFASRQAFYHAFQENFHCTPTEYRKQINKNNKEKSNV